jgi:dTMP kinase
LRVTLTREPGGSPLAAGIRKLLLDPRMRGLHPHAELLLFAADRRQHVADTIAPALRRGDLVLCDRFTDSTTAYQGAGRSVSPEALEWISRFAAQGLVPDLTLLFDLPIEEGLKRARVAKGGLDRMEDSARAYFSRVRKGFLKLAREEPRRVKLIKVLGREADNICAEALGLVEASLEGR